MKMTISKFGFVKSTGNPEPLFDLPKCDPCATRTTCKDTITVLTAETVTGVTLLVDGVSTPIVFAAPVTGQANVLAAIKAEFAKIEGDVWVKSNTAVGGYTIEHIGQTRLVSVQGAIGAVTSICTLAQQCDYVAKVSGATDINGTTLANSPYAFSPDASAALKTDIETELGVQGIAFVSVAVSRNTQIQKYEVVISAIQSSDLDDATVNGLGLLKCNCMEVFA